MALWETELIACGEEALCYCEGGGKFVGFGEEGRSVAFADFEIPIWGLLASSLC
jgi:hypothetical protein